MTALPFTALQNPIAGQLVGNRRRVAAIAKRALDVTCAAVAVAMLLVPMLIIAGAILADDSAPIFFRQTRAGRNGTPFRILKFRTMVVDAEERLRRNPELMSRYLSGDNKLDPCEDVRITRIGRFLRTTSLDELPQLFNVLCGSMSLVGPRPVLYSELCHYGDRVGRVLSVRPGMTGLWQISGRSFVGRAERVQLDEAYARRWSVAGDLAIMARTVVTVVTRNGAL